MTIRGNSILSVERYWDLPSGVNSALSFDDAKTQLHALLNTAVKHQMISDRPLGLFLSGGLDSASLLSCMHEQGVESRTFFIGFADNPYTLNESSDAAALARHFDANHTPIVVDSDEVTKLFPAYFESLDQPSVDGLNTFLVSHFASRSLTVAVSGLGGDELFAGYARHALLLWKSHHAKFQWASRLSSMRSATALTKPFSMLLWRWRAYGESTIFS